MQIGFDVMTSWVALCNIEMHYSDVIISTVASQIISLTIVYSTTYSGADQREHQNFASLAFVRGMHWWPMNSPQKGPVTWKMFPFNDVIMDEWTAGRLSHTPWVKFGKKHRLSCIYALCCDVLLHKDGVDTDSSHRTFVVIIFDFCS